MTVLKSLGKGGSFTLDKNLIEVKCECGRTHILEIGLRGYALSIHPVDQRAAPTLDLGSDISGIVPNFKPRRLP